jgi:hypothetical protein
LNAATPGIAEAEKIYAWHPPTTVSSGANTGLLELETFTCETMVEA